MVKNKALTFAPAFKNESNKFFEILINNTSSTSKKIEPSILVRESSDTIEDNRYLNKVNKFTASWTEQKNHLNRWKRYFYNEEFDPGSGWTLATGLTHASRGAAWPSNRLMATGARVSNTYPTCRLFRDSLSKERLILDSITRRHLLVIKEFR